MAAGAALNPIGVIALARMSSRRLPGKALLPLGDRPLLAWVLDRLRRVAVPGPVILATSGTAEDDPLAAVAEREGVAVHRGALDDVAGRFLGAMSVFGLERAVRVSADSPFIDPGLIDRMIGLARQRPGLDADLVTNVAPRSFPPGCSVEIIRRTALARAIAEMTEASDREHVTSYLYRHPDRFRIVNHATGDDRYRGVALTVDTATDLDRARRLAAALGPTAVAADLETVVAAWRRIVAEETQCHAG